MEQMNLTRKDLEPLSGPRGRVAEVINRRRPLTPAMLRKLHETLQISLGCHTLTRSEAKGKVCPTSDRQRIAR